MSLNGIIGSALSGLSASQAGLNSAANNVANVNTPGYARTEAVLQALNVGGVAMGVQVAGISRIADVYLQAASIRAISAGEAARVQADGLDKVQSQFGKLDDEGSMFARLSRAFSSLSQASVDPSQSVARLSAAADLQAFFDETNRLSLMIGDQRKDADAQIQAAVQRTNEILSELSGLNASAQSVSVAGGDTSGIANRQSELLDELSGYVDIRTETKAGGRLVIRTGDGVALVETGVTQLEYTPTGSGAYGVSYGQILVQPPNGAEARELSGHIQSGKLFGLLDLRDRILPEIADELAELTAGAADALNLAHNNSASYPAPQSLTGRNTGLVAADLHSFTGATTLAVTAASGTLVKRVDIDFDAGTLSVDGGAAVAIGTTVGSLTTAINTALGGDGSATFANGVLTLAASTAGNGVATLEDATTPSDRAGRGFSHFFGLNDLVSSSRPGFFETGLSAADAHQFTTGTSLSFQITTPDGRPSGTIDIPMVTGQTVGDAVTALNNTTTGLGRYATFTLDSDGKLSSVPKTGYDGFDLNLTGDDTSRSGTGVSFSQLFGIGLAATAGRSEVFSVNNAIRSDSSKLALGQLNLDAATVAGDLVLTSGDARGGQLLQSAMTSTRSFDAAGSINAANSSLQDYAARLAGSVGSRAARAESEAASADVLRTTAQTKRSNVEGVSLDEELAAMTLYQQSYNASARMLQAAKEMTDTLMSIV
ncbi:flagellar hook-associated protein FlgK [Maricaulis salignorans]|uniref:Flagellar hook-associated protein 1 n=1 Tax=Maricaulis salignorans TaxID=144026 RepID=A0A1G9N0I0_9PROT|nr:flagellar hook-associated protein FlgK [Maricaulis salignorans]SDL79751.1 flagellar hook-associated protein 1 FlgK [Maricaulis salignorans]